MSELLRYNTDRKFCLFDLETESLNLFDNKPWEIGITIYQNKKVIKEEVVYVKWKSLNVSQKAAMMTKYAYYEKNFKTGEFQEVPDSRAKKHLVEKHGVSPLEACEKLSNIIYDKDVYSVGSNLIGFDCHVFNSMRRRLGLPVDYSFVNRIYDTHALTKAYLLDGAIEVPKNQEENFAWQMKIINHSSRVRSGIKAACSCLGVEYDANAHHDALADNNMTKEIFNKLIWELEIV